MRRWEIERGLPVYRTPGSGRGVVYAFTSELEEWLRRPQSQGSQSVDSDLRRAAGAVVPDESAATHGETGRTTDRWRSQALPWALAGVFVITVSAGIYSYRQTARFKTLAATQQPKAPTRDTYVGSDSIAVMPFTNVRRDASAEYLSDGITESLIGNLAHVPHMKVRSRDSVFRYKGKDLDVPTLASQLGVSILVTGRVMVRGDNIEIGTELTDARDNTEIWGQKYSGRSADLISLQQKMAGDIAEKLHSTLSSTEKQQVTNQGTEDAEAYALYLKGRYAWNKRTRRDLESAISYFNQAIAKDPSYALAYSGVADTYSVLPNFGGNPAEDFPKSNAAARKALELDPALARPHAVLGMNETEYDWDFAGGEAEFKKAIELDPNDATSHQWYAEKLSDLGRHDEALAEIDRAHQLDPLSPVITRVVAGTLVDAGRHDEGIAVCKRLSQENPSLPLAHDCLAYAYWAKRMYPQVVEEWKTYGQLTGNPDDLEFGAALEQGFQSSGWKGALTQAASNLQVRRKTGYVSPARIARFYADLGDKGQAFQWLDVAYQEHDRVLIGLNIWPQSDNLRSDPRFVELANKVGLPKTR